MSLPRLYVFILLFLVCAVIPASAYAKSTDSKPVLANNTVLKLKVPERVQFGGTYQATWKSTSGPSLKKILKAYPEAYGDLVAFPRGYAYPTNPTPGIVTILERIPAKTLLAGRVDWVATSGVNRSPMVLGDYLLQLVVMVPTSPGSSLGVAQGNSDYFTVSGTVPVVEKSTASVSVTNTPKQLSVSITGVKKNSYTIGKALSGKVHVDGGTAGQRICLSLTKDNKDLIAFPFDLSCGLEINSRGEVRFSGKIPTSVSTLVPGTYYLRAEVYAADAWSGGYGFPLGTGTSHEFDIRR